MLAKRFRRDRCDNRLSLGAYVLGKVIRMTRGLIRIFKMG
jgi:hypothetical protein